MNLWYGKLMAAVAAGTYALGYLSSWREWHFIDYVTLILHEAGHPLFALFGEQATVLGGTILQLCMPALFVAYFIFTNQRFSAAIVSYWFGFSLISVGIYAADAKAQVLPLLGDGHDWAYLFSVWGLLDSAEIIGRYIIDAGFVVVVVALLWSGWELSREWKMRNPVLSPNTGGN